MKENTKLKQKKLNIKKFDQEFRYLLNENQYLKNHIEETKNKLLTTDNYLEKYLPFRIQTFISETLHAVLDKKSRLILHEYEDDKFGEMHHVILEDNGVSYLDKTESVLPNIVNYSTLQEQVQVEEQRESEVQRKRENEKKKKKELEFEQNKKERESKKANKANQEKEKEGEKKKELDDQSRNDSNFASEKTPVSKRGLTSLKKKDTGETTSEFSSFRDQKSTEQVPMPVSSQRKESMRLERVYSSKRQRDSVRSKKEEEIKASVENAQDFTHVEPDPAQIEEAVQQAFESKSRTDVSGTPGRASFGQKFPTPHAMALEEIPENASRRNTGLIDSAQNRSKGTIHAATIIPSGTLSPPDKDQSRRGSNLQPGSSVGSRRPSYIDNRRKSNALVDYSLIEKKIESLQMIFKQEIMKNFEK